MRTRTISSTGTRPRRGSARAGRLPDLVRAQGGRWAGLLRDLWARCAGEIALRRDVARLEDLPGHLLRDLGLTRSDIADAVRHGRPDLRADWL